MFGLTTLFKAIGNLTSALNGLADTTNQINAGVRQRLMLDVPDQDQPSTAVPVVPQLTDHRNEVESEPVTSGTNGTGKRLAKKT